MLEMRMLRKLAFPAALIAAAALSACVGPGRGRVDVGIAGGPGYYDSYYDGYYGPFVDGYWGGDGGYWYMDRNRGWHRDQGGHFRRDGRSGYNHVHGSGAHRDH